MAEKNYNNLIRELAATDFKLKYKGSFFGYLWSLVKPLFLFLVLYTVFTKIFKIGASVPFYPVYLLLGITIWQFFAETTVISMHSIVGRGDLLRKVYFPRIIFPIAATLSSLITFILNMVVVFGFAYFSQVKFSANLILLIPLILELYLFVLGITFFLSSLYVRYRDISHIWDVFLQALFYATPIIYPITLVPKRFLGIIMANPVAQIIQDFRWVIISKDISTSIKVNGYYGWIPYVLTIIIFILGYQVFQSAANQFAEEV